MRLVGFSTGALLAAGCGLRDALSVLLLHGVRAVELSALRWHELGPLLEELPELLRLQLADFDYVSVHAPSAYAAADERGLAAALGPVAALGVPVVLHPDAIADPACWAPLGSSLCVENMDRRKRTGRTAAELSAIFDALPRASFCFDIGHAHQVDPTMAQAGLLLLRHGGRLRQLHVSRVGPQGLHGPIDGAAAAAFAQVAALVPDSVPLIIETPVAREGDIPQVIAAVRAALPIAQREAPR